MPATTRRVLGTYRTGLPAPLRPARTLGTARLSGAQPTGPVRPVTFPTTRLITRVMIALGADLTASPLSWQWEDITGFLRQDLGISQTAGRPDGSTRVNYGRATLKLDNRDGRFTRRNPNGPYFGLLSGNTPIWITVDAGSGQNARIQMFVNDWPTRWSDKSATDSTVTIQCAGILRRLNQGNAAKTAIQRSAQARNPVALWMLGDAIGSTSGASSVAGGSPMRTLSNPNGTAVVFGEAGPPGGLTSAFMESGTVMSGTVSGCSTTSWYGFFSCLPDITASGQCSVDFGCSGSTTARTVRLYPPDPTVLVGAQLYIQDNTAPSPGVTLFVDGSGYPGAAYFTTWHDYGVTLTQSGTTLTATLYVDGIQVGTGSATATMSAVDSVTVTPIQSQRGGNLAGIAVMNSTTIIAGGNGAATGFAGEQAHTRMTRLCADQGVQFVTLADRSVVMGVQSVSKFVDLLNEAEDVDQGALFETAWGLGYQSVAERTNAAVGFALDFDLKQIAQIPEPADDDQRLRNLVTASRSGGSIGATAEQLTGPLRTGAGGPGVYEDAVTVNVQTDAQLADAAGWRKHLGTVDEDRWPSISINMTRSPELIDTWATLPYGVRMNASNPPAQMPPDTIDAIVEGFSEAWDPYNWVATLVTSPFSPYRTGTLAADSGDTTNTLLILTPDTLTLAVGVNTTDVTWSINSSPIWTGNSEYFPRYIWWEGEVVQLTNCVGAAAPQTWTVVRSINGVVKAHLANSSGQIYSPGVLALA